MKDSLKRVHPSIRRNARTLRRNQTPMERKLWSHLRRRQNENLRFRRQHPIQNFIVDFYCPEYRLIIEVDGEMHSENTAYHEARERHLASEGYRILRFSNEQVRDDVEGVILTILSEVDETGEAVDDEMSL